MPTPNDMPPQRPERPTQDEFGPAIEAMHGPELSEEMIAERVRNEPIPAPNPPRPRDDTEKPAPPPSETDVEYTGSGEGGERDVASLEAGVKSVLTELDRRERDRKVLDARRRLGDLLGSEERGDRPVTAEELEEARRTLHDLQVPPEEEQPPED